MPSNAKFVNGQNRHITIFIISNHETENYLDCLGPGDELLVYGKVHIYHGHKTRLFVDDFDKVDIQHRRFLNDNAIRQKTTDPQKISN